MLDELFSMMEEDQFASWKIHGRIRTKVGPVDFVIPHSFSDGRLCVEKVAKPLISFVGDENLLSTVLTSKDQSVSGHPHLTPFQRELSNLLANSRLSTHKRIAIAVALEHESFMDGQRNKVAFPVFDREELAALSSKAGWQTTLRERAEREVQDYLRWSKLLKSKSRDIRARLLSRAPLQQCDLVISYFGNLSRLLDGSDLRAQALSFGVTTTHGPREVLVCYSDSRGFRGMLTSSAHPHPDWNQLSVFAESL